MLKNLIECYKSPSRNKVYYYNKLREVVTALNQITSVNECGISSFNCNYFTYEIITKDNIVIIFTYLNCYVYGDKNKAKILIDKLMQVEDIKYNIYRAWLNNCKFKGVK